MSRDYWSNNLTQNKQSKGFYIGCGILLELYLVPMLIDIVFRNYLVSPFAKYILFGTAILLVGGFLGLITYRYRFYFYFRFYSFFILLFLVVGGVFYINKQEIKLWTKK